MKKRTLILTVISILTILLSLWMHSYYRDAKFQVPGIFFLLLLVLFAMGATWFIYRNEWYLVLGLKTNDITRKILLKVFTTALVINIIGSGTVFVVYFLIFKEMPLSLLGDNLDPLKLLSVALIVAPLTEEILFRGFIQGMWQNLYRDKEKTPSKLIITVTALLFTVSHFHFLFNITLKQFLLFTIPLFIIALYMGWLRQKYQSIIPSIVAHLGFNSALIVAPLIGIIFYAISPTHKVSEIRRQMEVAQYKNDTIPYNFDPNDLVEWEKSYKKFSVLERPRSEEIAKHIKGYSFSITVNFIIDTCGYVDNVHVSEWDESHYVKEYGYDLTKDAIRCIESLPQCKPYVVDGKKVEKKMTVQVPFY